MRVSMTIHVQKWRLEPNGTLTHTSIALQSSKPGSEQPYHIQDLIAAKRLRPSRMQKQHPINEWKIQKKNENN